LGLGDTLYRYYPTQIGSDHDWVCLGNSGDYFVGVKANGSLWAWGNNAHGQLGQGDSIDRWIPTQIGSDHDWVLAVADGTTLALKANGTIWGCGDNFYGSLGQGYFGLYFPNLVQVGSEDDWTYIGFQNHSIALKSNGGLWAWGNNTSGEMGLGFVSFGIDTPTATGTPATEWVSGAVGGSHTVALRSEGTLWSWGSNDHGQLGTGNNTDQNTPVMSGNDSNWVAVSAGEDHTAALKSNGTLWSWGDNGNGQLGIGNYNDQDNPQQVSGSNWASVSCGSAHSLALKADGTLWAWGDNSSGQLGTGNYSTFTSPVQIGSYDKWLAIAAGGKHSLALKADGSLWAWGRNTEGQLGTGNNTVQLSPVQVGAGDTWVWISAGDQYSLALKADGTLWAWGMNSDGQLGIGNYNNQNSPIQIGAANDWIAANAGKAHSIAWKVDGTIWSWGNNDYGQLGLGNNTGYNSPQQVTQTPIVHIFSGPEADHSGVLKDDRSLICLAGHNDKGQLGDGTFIDKNTFNCINNCVEPGISIAAIPGDTVCSADSTWFVATTSNGGPTPGYQWYKNNQPVGGNNDSLYLAGLNTGDQVYCVLTGSAACNVYPTDTSDTITVVVVQSVTPTITIAADLGDTICQEHVSTYTASITNGGPSPAYQWYENNNPVGTNSNTYVPLQISGNIIKCKLTSSAVCPSPHEVTSAAHTMLIVPVTIPQVTITANPGTAIAQNQSVTFTANVTNATNPQYQWKKNGSNLPGETQQTYTTTTLQNGDQIACRVRGLSECDTALSAPLTMSVWAVNVANVGNASMEVNVYPNPVKEVLQIGYSNITEGQMELCDMAGKVLIQQPLSHSMDLKGLASGVYMLHVLDKATGYDSVHMVVKD
jgi:alpha-tubulin suppressor-like RCC1 family protein